MSATVLYMSMSLDGFIAGPNETRENGLGDGGLRLHDWVMRDGDVDVEAIRRSGTVNGSIVDEFMGTGAVVAGRGTFEPAGGWGGDHHDGVPIFILSRHEPPAAYLGLQQLAQRAVGRLGRRADAAERHGGAGTHFLGPLADGGFQHRHGGSRLRTDGSQR